MWGIIVLEKIQAQEQGKIYINNKVIMFRFRGLRCLAS